MTIFNLANYDVVFISYDEPNAEQNWEDLVTKVPKAKRVHGVKGLATAHRTAGRLSTTDKTITIDGDNRLFKDLTNRSFEIDEECDFKEILLNWPSKNIINGLEYGNGGIKLWPTHILANCSTDEFATKGTPQQVDYSYGLKNQITFHECYSYIYSNASPLQSWRAAFREGVKLGLKRGVKVDDLADYWPGGRKRLSLWMTVGADIENGIWSMLGARQGCYLTQFTDWDMSNNGDFDYLNNYFQNNVAILSETEALVECAKLGNIIGQKFEICDPFTPEQSKFVKNMNPDPDAQERSGWHWVSKPQWN